MRQAIAMGLGAYALWGLLPLYFRQLPDVPTLQILCHRMLWSLPLLAGLLLLRGDWDWLRRVGVRLLLRVAASAALLSVNWGLNIWAVTHDQVLAASLGYFINPLLNVALGALLLGESVRGVQWLACAMAAAGVTLLALQQGTPPWLALGIASSFAGYGLLRKTMPLDALRGLALESTMLAPLALLTLVWGAAQGHDAFVAGDWTRRAWLACAGPVTAVPLLLFAAAARRIDLSLLGVLQYLTPTLLLLLGVRLYGEPFDAGRAHGFALIWSGCALYLAYASTPPARESGRT